uniref:Uncharacterized protein n=1 Tax=Myoviridae sp. ct2798 TaxID=2827285 RepID=A0A8S5R4L9_9CAUD|nr:MAG TPA: hypothetical protein [Myoviridae sp. ct2798]
MQRGFEHRSFLKAGVSSTFWPSDCFRRLFFFIRQNQLLISWSSCLRTSSGSISTALRFPIIRCSLYQAQFGLFSLPPA